ncbi:MAG TPA: DUF1877 family protein [Streptosporangiaceae bacterium]|jgi:hypothetical protein
MTYLRLPPTLEGETDPGRISRLVFGAADWRKRHPSAQLLDIGEIWQGLNYLITGDPWDGKPPASDIVCGGRLLTEDGAEELGMDVLYLAPDRVKPAADHLLGTSFDAIAGRYNVKQMTSLEVQGAGTWPKDARERMFRRAYESLTDFYAAATTEGQAIFKTMA